MANTLRFKRGLVAGIPNGALGEPLFTTDTFDLYIGNGTGNTRFQKYIASGATTQILRGDGSLYTFPLNISSPSNGQVLKYDGTNWVNSADAGVTGSGTAGQVTYWGSSSTITGSNNLFWDATNNRLGIGTTTPSAKISINGTSTDSYILNFIRQFGVEGSLFTDGGGIAITQGLLSEAGIYLSRNSRIDFRVNGSERMRLFSTGNFAINSTTDNGLRFQVTGDGFFSGSVGIGTTAITDVNLYIRKNLSGSVFPSGLYIDSTVQSTSTTGAAYISTSVSTQASTFTLPNLYHFRATQSTIGAGSTVTNQYGYIAEASLIGATNNFGFYGNIASGTGRWNLYMNGTANNFTAGDFYVGQPVLRTSDASIRKFILNGSQIGIGAEIVLTNETANDAASNAISFVGIRGDYGISGQIRTTRRGIMTFHTQDLQSLVSPPERMRLDASGNLGLGVTPSAWNTLIPLQIARGSFTANNSELDINHNAFYDGTWKYIANGFATNHYTTSGTYVWRTAASGTANAAITWTTAMTLDASGNLAVGTTNTDIFSRGDARNVVISATGASDNMSLQLNGGASGGRGAQIYMGTGGVRYFTIGTNVNETQLGTVTSTPMIFYTNNTIRMRLDASGNLGLGVTPSAWGILRAIQVGLTGNLSGYISSTEGAFFSSNSFYNGGAFVYQVTGNATQYEQKSGRHIWSTAASGTAGTNISFTQALTLFATGNLAVNTPTDSGFRLDVNGTMRVSGNATFGTNTLFVDNGSTRVGIGNTAPNGKIDITGSLGNFRVLDSGAEVYFTRNGNNDIIANTGASAGITIGGQNYVRIGTGSPVTQRLEINSTGAATFSSSVNVGTNLTVDTNTFFVDATNNRVGIGTLIPDATFRVAGAINSTQAIFGNVDGRGLAISTSIIGGTNEAGVILNARSSVTSGTFIFQTDGTQRVLIDSSGLTVTGGNGYEVVNSASNNVTALRPTGGGTSIMSTNSNGLHIAVGTEAAGDLILASNNTERIRLSSNGFFSQINATNPSSSITDSYIQYSADVTAGNAAPHFRTENGAVIKLYQETTGVGNAIFSQGGGNSVLDDSTFDGYTLRQIVKALRNQGILQ